MGRIRFWEVVNRGTFRFWGFCQVLTMTTLRFWGFCPILTLTTFRFMGFWHVLTMGTLEFIDVFDPGTFEFRAILCKPTNIDGNILYFILHARQCLGAILFPVALPNLEVKYPLYIDRQGFKDTINEPWR